MEDFITLTGYSKSRAYKAVHNSELPYFKPNGPSGKTYFKLEDVEAYLLRNRVESRQEVLAQAVI